MVSLVEFEQLIDLQRMEHEGGRTFDFLWAVLSDSEISYSLASTKFYGFKKFFMVLANENISFNIDDYAY